MSTCSTCGRQWEPMIEFCPEDGTALLQVAVGAVLAATGTGDVSISVASDERLATGALVGEYRIERVIGEGGMGVVYGAVQPLIGKRVAIKVLPARMSADREGVARFVQEAQAVNRIGHTNIVDIFSFGTLPDGRAYFVMEWLLGETLAERIQRGTMPSADVVATLRALVRALEAAHAAGVIHRDLKPENVFLVADDDAPRVKLLDFGIAKLSTVSQPTSRTATGITVGTPLYMSPEQARGDAIDARTDVYSLGVVAYEMLCGKTPFDAESSAVEVMHAHIVKPPRTPRELRPDVPDALETLVLALLAKPAVDRPTLADVRGRLAALATSPSLVAAPDARTAVSRRVRAPAPGELDVADEPAAPRRRIGMIAGAAIAVAVLGVAAVSLGSRPSVPDASRLVAVAQTAMHELAVPAPASAPSSPVAAAMAVPPSPSTALDLAIEPDTASVTLDGKAVTIVRGHVHATIDPGPHVASARAAGYQSTQQHFEVVAGAPTELTLRLAHVRTASPGRAVVAPQPTDRDAVVDPFHRK